MARISFAYQMQQETLVLKDVSEVQEVGRKLALSGKRIVAMHCGREIEITVERDTALEAQAAAALIG